MTIYLHKGICNMYTIMAVSLLRVRERERERDRKREGERQ